MVSLVEHPGVSTVTGSSQEVREILATRHPEKDERVLAITFAHSNAENVEIIADNLLRITESLAATLQTRQARSALERLVDLMVPSKPPTPQLLREADMRIRARAAVLESGDWLTATDIAQLAGFSRTNPSSQPNKWKKAGQIFAIHHGGTDYFPGYGLDQDSGYRPRKSLANIISVFDGHKSGWGMAYWFMSENSFLGGRRPQDVLALDPERVIAAAEDEILPISHG